MFRILKAQFLVMRWFYLPGVSPFTKPIKNAGNIVLTGKAICINGDRQAADGSDGHHAGREDSAAQHHLHQRRPEDPEVRKLHIITRCEELATCIAASACTQIVVCSVAAVVCQRGSRHVCNRRCYDRINARGEPHIMVTFIMVTFILPTMYGHSWRLSGPTLLHGHCGEYEHNCSQLDIIMALRRFAAWRNPPACKFSSPR